MVVVPNKCFIHSPAGRQAEIIVFGLHERGILKRFFIEAGLWIKQGCAKPLGGRAGTIACYGYSIESGHYK